MTTSIQKNWKTGVGFLLWILCMDVLDEVIIPAAFTFAGYPQIALLSFVLDLDWMTYPLYFLVVRLWK